MLHSNFLLYSRRVVATDENRMKFLQLHLLVVLISLTSAELFSAVEKLESLTKNEDKLKVEYEKLLSGLEEVVDDLKR